jgi:hypothetical protein
LSSDEGCIYDADCGGDCDRQYSNTGKQQFLAAGQFLHDVIFHDPSIRV